MLTEWLVIRADGWLDLHENTGKHRQTLDTKLVSGWMSDVSLVTKRLNFILTELFGAAWCSTLSM